MPCIPDAKIITPARLSAVKAALARLESALATGAAQVVISPTGAIAFKGWTERADVSDLCAYRKLAAENSPALRRAIARAEVIAGRTLDQRTVAAGMHSHDGGRTWGTHQ